MKSNIHTALSSPLVLNVLQVQLAASIQPLYKHGRGWWAAVRPEAAATGWLVGHTSPCFPVTKGMRTLTSWPHTQQLGTIKQNQAENVPALVV